MRSSTRCLVATASLFALTWSSAALADQWQNETGNAQECDYCVLKYPSSFLVASSGMTSPQIFGEIYEAGITDQGPNPASILAELGYGPAGSDPRTSSQWSWSVATYNAQVGYSAEYVAQLTAPIDGSYSYTFRFSLDGTSFTLADLTGAGAFPGLSFEVAQLGSFTVGTTPPITPPITPPMAIPEPETYAMMLAGLALLGFTSRQRRRA